MYESCGRESQREPKVDVRTNFNPLAAFFGSLITDVQGEVTTKIKAPDTLTNYTIFALATTARCFGKSTSEFVVQLPLMIRPSLPRFMNWGDNAKFSVVLVNQTSKSQEVIVGIKAENAVLNGDKALRLTLKKGNLTIFFWC
jgi:uncharacterized protein YfaS (alpha-2-macroglobulin family)